MTYGVFEALLHSSKPSGNVKLVKSFQSRKHSKILFQCCNFTDDIFFSWMQVCIWSSKSAVTFDEASLLGRWLISWAETEEIPPNKPNSKIQTSLNVKNHHHNQGHLGAPSIDFSWHIWIFGLPDSLGIFFIKWKIFLNLFQKNLYFTKKYLAQILPYQNGCQ